MLGIRLTIFDVFRLGAYGVPIVLACILGALLITTWINRWLALPRRLGTLIAVGTSICGVSAILATSPAVDAEEQETAYAVAVITIFGLLATLFYPYLVNLIFPDQALQAGLFLGTSVHDTSQVVGSAKVYSDVFSLPLALDVATVTKLVRNAFMVFVIPIMAYMYNRGEASGKTNLVSLLPLFVLGFLMLAILRSIGDAGLRSGGLAYGVLEARAWDSVILTIRSWAGNFLVIALAGVGLSTDVSTFRGLGFKPFFVGLLAAFSVGVVSVLAITLLGNFVAL